MIWVSGGDHPNEDGNVFIDLGGDAANPTAAVIQQVVDLMSGDSRYAYLIIHLGFTIAGEFFEYANGVIR